MKAKNKYSEKLAELKEFKKELEKKIKNIDDKFDLPSQKEKEKAVNHLVDLIKEVINM